MLHSGQDRKQFLFCWSWNITWKKSLRLQFMLTCGPYWTHGTDLSAQNSWSLVCPIASAEKLPTRQNTQTYSHIHRWLQLHCCNLPSGVYDHTASKSVLAVRSGGKQRVGEKPEKNTGGRAVRQLNHDVIKRCQAGFPGTTPTPTLVNLTLLLLNEIY